MRHGHAEKAASGAEDRDRRLTEEGKAAVARTHAKLKELGLLTEGALLMSSVAQRAVESLPGGTASDHTPVPRLFMQRDEAAEEKFTAALKKHGFTAYADYLEDGRVSVTEEWARDAAENLSVAIGWHEESEHSIFVATHAIIANGVAIEVLKTRPHDPAGMELLMRYKLMEAEAIVIQGGEVTIVKP